MLRKSKIDSDPNSIYGASKKLASIAVRNMKNLSDNPDMQLGLDQLPASTLTAQQPSMTASNSKVISSFEPNNVSSFKVPVNLQQPNIKNTYVDEFLGKILDAGSYLQQVYLTNKLQDHVMGNYGRYDFDYDNNRFHTHRNENETHGGVLSDDEDNDENIRHSRISTSLSHLGTMIRRPNRSTPPRFRLRDNNTSTQSYWRLRANGVPISEALTNSRLRNETKDSSSSNPSSSSSSSSIHSSQSSRPVSVGIGSVGMYNDNDSFLSSLSSSMGSHSAMYPDDPSSHHSDISEDDLNNEKDMIVEVIKSMSVFNTKMNELYVFFKGKIKPNLKSFDKSDIQNMMTDMNTLNENFIDVKDLIADQYENIFGINKSHKHPKIDTFIDTFEKNFTKSYSDIIATLKAYHTLGVINGSGLMMHDCMRSRMHNSHKYLM